MLEVEEEGSSGLNPERPTTDPISIQPPTAEAGHFQQNPSDISGVSLSPPSLNGQTDTFWQIVRDNPEALPSQIANKLHGATGRNITGAQVKQLIAAGPPAMDPNDGSI